MTYTLNVNKAGTGTGFVSSANLSGINCGTDCSENYNAGTNVILSASANNGSTFTGWSGACSGTSSTCAVSMTANKTVTATFTLVPPIIPLPTVDLRVNGSNGPITIPNINDGATLTWTSKNANRCETSNGVNGWKNSSNWKTSGEFETGFLESGKTFKITCYNSAGAMAYDSVRIIVEAKICLPTATLSARVNNLDNTGGYILTWNSTYADSCSAAWTGKTSPSGKQKVSPTETTSYSIVCTGPGGNVTASTTVTIAE